MGPKGSTPHSSEPATFLYPEPAQTQSVPSHLMSLRSVSSIIHPTMPRFSKWPISLLPQQMASEVYKSFCSFKCLRGVSGWFFLLYYSNDILHQVCGFLLVLSLQLLQVCSGLPSHLKGHLGGFAWALRLLAFALLCGTPHSSHSSISTAICRHLLTFRMQILLCILQPSWHVLWLLYR